MKTCVVFEVHLTGFQYDVCIELLICDDQPVYLFWTSDWILTMSLETFMGLADMPQDVLVDGKSMDSLES